MNQNISGKQIPSCSFFRFPLHAYLENKTFWGCWSSKTLLDIKVIDQCPVQHFPPVSAHVLMCIFVSYRRVSRLVRTWSRVKGSAVGCFTSTVSVRHSNPTRSCCVRSAAQVSCYLAKKSALDHFLTVTQCPQSDI